MPNIKKTAPLLDRRNLLKLTAASASTVAGIWWPGASWGQAKISSNPFTLGVASGSPTSDGIVLWTRLLPSGIFSSLGNENASVRWEIAHDDKFQRIVQQGTSVATPQLGHSVHVELAGLTPDSWYYYRFHAGEFTSAIGRTRTLPAADAKVNSLRMAYASCQHWGHGFYGAYRHMAQEQLDLVMFLGDYIYEYPGTTNTANAVRLVTGGWVQSLADYRQRYALHKSDADLQAAHLACPWVFTWDDHEVQNDYTGDTAGYASQAEPSTDFSKRRAAAYQAWYEHMPVRSSVLTKALAGLVERSSKPNELRIYQNLRWGQLANMMLLDPRQYKDPAVCNPDGRLGSGVIDPKTCEALKDPARTMLGKTQEDWLHQQLGMTGTTWQVVGQATLIGPFGASSRISNDGWDGYPAARERLLGSLAGSHASNVVIGGDVHANWVGHVKADYTKVRSKILASEFCGTSITSRPTAATRAVMDARLAKNPHYIFNDNEKRGYGVCEFSPSGLKTTLRVVEDVTKADTAVSTLASFSVQSGKLGVERI
jgi:alkaline phosphatase D